MPGMPRKKRNELYENDGQDKLLPRLSLFVYDHARSAAILWLCLTLLGVVVYTSLMKREGFPSVSIPFSLVTGTYLVNDPAKVDREVAKPISDIIVADERVQSVQSTARSMFYSVVVQYDSGTDTAQAAKDIEQRIRAEGVLPKQASVKVESPEFGFTQRGDDAVIALYATDKSVTTKELADEAARLSEDIRGRNDADILTVAPVDTFTQGNDPRTGKAVSTQTSFDRYGFRENGENRFYPSVAVGVRQREGSDVVKLYDRLQSAVADYNARQASGGFQATVSASYAPDIKEQVGELQRALLEGLLAVLFIGSLVIAVRASFITVLSMFTVLAITAAVLYGVGYTLNTITLFALILCLGLIVDDTIIMVEALDAQRKRLKDARVVVRVATRKVSRAMVAATLTAALSFAPLLFIGGILGSFIRAIPVTVITSLLVSLLVALVFIPLFARYLLLGKGQLGTGNAHEPAAGAEARIAAFISRPMVWAKHSYARIVAVGSVALLVTLAFLGASVFIGKNVAFNIFPPSKDTNGLTLRMAFPPGTDIRKAQVAADRAQQVVADTLGENFRNASYYANADDRTATLTINLTPYGERGPTAPQLETELDEAFKGFEGAKVDVSLLDVGPPASPFNIRIVGDDRKAAYELAEDLSSFLKQAELRRPSGEVARISEVTIADNATFSRADGRSYVAVTSTFDAKDTSALVTLAQAAVEKEFNADRLRDYGLDAGALTFDLGQEQENQDSFKALALAFPLLLVVIYFLLALQFRSWLQPLLIFMAIPFSLFGITLGLYLTDNSFSFFAALGFFALIGLSIKNTILLTDYANQLRREGVPAVDAAIGALAERFRPLIATSLTAVVSLIPLALTSPFWEGLAVVLIGGLLSSTFLVVTVFPYFYLGAEYLRLRVKLGRARRRAARSRR